MLRTSASSASRSDDNPYSDITATMTARIAVASSAVASRKRNSAELVVTGSTKIRPAQERTDTGDQGHTTYTHAACRAAFFGGSTQLMTPQTTQQRADGQTHGAERGLGRFEGFS